VQILDASFLPCGAATRMTGRQLARLEAVVACLDGARLRLLLGDPKDHLPTTIAAVIGARDRQGVLGIPLECAGRLAQGRKAGRDVEARLWCWPV
jgi:hypothetical protein